jgi:hypothetical protein
MTMAIEIKNLMNAWWKSGANPGLAGNGYG